MNIHVNKTYQMVGKIVSIPEHLGNTKSIARCSFLGDRFLQNAINSILGVDLNRNGYLNGFLNSNEFIGNWNTGFIRVKETKGIRKHQKMGKLSATLTEAWIWFLYENYGEEHTMRYIKKQIKKHAPKYL